MAGGKVHLVLYPPQRQGAGGILLPANTSKQKVPLQKAQPSPIVVFQPPAIKNIPISVVRSACLMVEQVCLPITLTIIPAHPVCYPCMERAPICGFMGVTVVVLQSPRGSRCHQRQHALCFRWGWKLWGFAISPLALHTGQCPVPPHQVFLPSSRLRDQPFYLYQPGSTNSSFRAFAFVAHAQKVVKKEKKKKKDFFP